MSLQRAMSPTAIPVPLLGAAEQQGNLPPNIVNGQVGIAEHQGNLMPTTTAAPTRLMPTSSDLQMDHRGNFYWPTIAHFHGAGAARQYSPVESPTKPQLHSTVSQLREELSSVTQQAHAHIAHQQLNFENAARNFEQEARDVRDAEVAQSEAQVQARFTGQLTQAQTTIQRAQEKLMTQAQRAQAAQEQSGRVPWHGKKGLCDRHLLRKDRVLPG